MELIRSPNGRVFLGQWGGILLDRLRFPGQHGFLDAQIGRFQQAGIGRDGIPGFQLDDIARNQLARGDFLQMPIAPDAHVRNSHALEGCHRLLGAVFLGKAEHSVENHDNHDDQRIDRLPQNDGNDRRNDQDHDHDPGKLLQQNRPGAFVPRSTSSFGPYSASRRAASAAVKPFCKSLLICVTASCVSSLCHSVIGTP